MKTRLTFRGFSRTALALGIALVAVLAFAPQYARAQDQPESRVNPTMVQIQRTMKAMEESTAENPAHVRVLFYGQSIVAQPWTEKVMQKLAEKYPTVVFESENRAIGGYESPVLVRTAETDLYPYYPDLLFFHVYGPLDKYEEIVRKVRETTSAEIVLWTSHLYKDQSAEEMLKNRDERSRGILEIAKKYNCAVIDLNKKWAEMLIDKGWETKKLLADGVHLNSQGIDIYANFIFEELVRIPGTSGEPGVSGTIRKFGMDAPEVAKGENGEIKFEFDGNRVVAVSDGTAGDCGAEVLLDGAKMEDKKELWTATRATNGPAWMPALNLPGFKQVPVKEEWNLIPIEGTKKDGSFFRYKVEGSVTGFDGEGDSDHDFVSNSGRVAIEATDLHMTWQFPYFKAEVPDDFKVTWSTYPLFADPYIPGAEGTRTVLVQNCANGKHVLTIRPKNGGAGIAKLLVYAPAK